MGINPRRDLRRPSHQAYAEKCQECSVENCFCHPVNNEGRVPIVSILCEGDEDCDHHWARRLSRRPGRIEGFYHGPATWYWRCTECETIARVNLPDLDPSLHVVPEDDPIAQCTSTTQGLYQFAVERDMDACEQFYIRKENEYAAWYHRLTGRDYPGYEDVPQPKEPEEAKEVEDQKTVEPAEPAGPKLSFSVGDKGHRHNLPKHCNEPSAKCKDCKFDDCFFHWKQNFGKVVQLTGLLPQTPETLECKHIWKRRVEWGLQGIAAWMFRCVKCDADNGINVPDMDPNYNETPGDPVTNFTCDISDGLYSSTCSAENLTLLQEMYETWFKRHHGAQQETPEVIRSVEPAMPVHDWRQDWIMHPRVINNAYGRGEETPAIFCPVVHADGVMHNYIDDELRSCCGTGPCVSCDSEDCMFHHSQNDTEVHVGYGEGVFPKDMPNHTGDLLCNHVWRREIRGCAVQGPTWWLWYCRQCGCRIAVNVNDLTPNGDWTGDPIANMTSRRRGLHSFAHDVRKRVKEEYIQFVRESKPMPRKDPKTHGQARRRGQDRFERVDLEIEHSGTKIILPNRPHSMTTEEAIACLQRHQKAQNEVVKIHEVAEALPLDGAHALWQVLKSRFGYTHAVPTPGFFGPTPPALVNLEIGYRQNTQVIWGQFEVPGIDGQLETGATYEDNIFKFCLSGEVKQKHRVEIQEIADQVRNYLLDHSVYKGKAIRIETNEDGEVSETGQPRFIDLSQVAPEELIFSKELMNQIQTNIWTPIQHTAECRKHDIPLKRGILLEGPYGTGKTLTAYVTAKLAVDNGWTFIYVDRVVGLRTAMKFAMNFQPAIVFAEDVDHVVKEKRNISTDDVLNLIDGVDSKGGELMVILTTNHVEDIGKAMLRPGRLDAVMCVEAPDDDAAEKLMRVYGRGLIPEGTPLPLAKVAAAGQIPATIREIVERAKLFAIKRGGDLTLTDDDLHAAASGMKRHLDLLAPPDASMTVNEQLGQTFSDVVRGVVAADTEPLKKQIEEIHKHYA